MAKQELLEACKFAIRVLEDVKHCNTGQNGMWDTAQRQIQQALDSEQDG